MTDHPGGVQQRILPAFIVMMGLVCASAGAAEPKCIFEDASLTGKEIYFSSEAAENITVVMGDFRFKVGNFTASGDKAVVWVRQVKVGSAVRNDITIYIEGDARAGENRGGAEGTKALMVQLQTQGKLRAKGLLMKKPVKELAIYDRATAARTNQAKEARPVKKPATQPIKRPAPATVPTTGPTTAPTTLAASAPAKNANVVELLPAPVVRPIEPASTKPAPPVTFHAERVQGEVLKDGRKVIIGRGKVYLSQNDPDSDNFLELRCQEAVLFVSPIQKKDSRHPASPTLSGVKTGEGTTESVTGVYLRGDVILARGERYTRATEAYYDFNTDRAIIMDPVFRTVQEQRNIPIYVRASEARMLSAREMWFKDATVSTSDFYTPTYGVSAKEAYIMDTTPYDAKGVRIGENSSEAKLKNVTFDVRGVPVFYWPYQAGSLEESSSALRTVRVGSEGTMGLGVASEWHLFRLLGLVRPKGYRAYLDLELYEQAAIAGIDLEYSRTEPRRDYAGYWKLYGVYDFKGEDDLGDARSNVEAPTNRGRILGRHKEYLPQDWTVQAEVSYISDRNFLQEFFPNEFRAGKPQETLLYANKQRDNWAFTSLMQYRLNRFQSQGESLPDLAFHLLGESLLQDRLSWFSENHAGLMRYEWDNALKRDASDVFGRVDTRQEIDVPLHFGPLIAVPYAVGRGTYWGSKFDDEGVYWRPYGQAGVKLRTHFWRVYDKINSRLWDVNKIRHVITPEAFGFIAGTNVQPSNLYPLNPGIEEHLDGTSGFSVGVRQRWQTKRGPAGNQRIVDWMRLNVAVGVFDGQHNTLTSDGRFFEYRPEYSLAQNFVNAEYYWAVSDSTSFMSETNYDMDSGAIRRQNLGLAVQRDPRIRYFFGWRYIHDLSSSMVTAGVNYKINKKYTVSLFEQYDLDYEGGRNFATSATIVRKFPRWYGAFTFSYDQTTDNLSLYVTFWPEGVPEVKLSTGRYSILGQSSEN